MGKPLDRRSVDTLPLFPLFLKLRGRRCLVVGAGKISEGKIAGLLEAGGQVRVVAPKATDRIVRWQEEKRIRLEKRAFRPKDLDGVFLVVAATNSAKVHREIYRHAHTRRVLCNIVDVPSLCDFYYPAVVRRGMLQIAISTEGASPSLARRLREEMEMAFGPEYAAWLKHLSHQRKKLMTKRMPIAERTELFKRQASREAFVQFARQKAKRSKNKKTIRS
jgi:precorrin-2 dehydrogenase/sirohydrochlorin ferrochelatase